MPSKPLWVWDEKSQRYRDTVTGRYVGVNQMNELRPEFFTQQKTLLRNTTAKYIDGGLSPKQYADQVKLIIKDTYIDMYAMGAGGRHNLSARDWGRIGAMVKEQYGYLNGLFNDIESGRITPAQAASRLNMYVNSANEAMWKGITRDLPKLPAYPGDGSTICLTNCQCTWEIVPVEGGYNCYWRLGIAEHCDDCVQRSREWNPLFVPYGTGA